MFASSNFSFYNKKNTIYEILSGVLLKRNKSWQYFDCTCSIKRASHSFLSTTFKCWDFVLYTGGPTKCETLMTLYLTIWTLNLVLCLEINWKNVAQSSLKSHSLWVNQYICILWNYCVLYHSSSLHHEFHNKRAIK